MGIEAIRRLIPTGAFMVRTGRLQWVLILNDTFAYQQIQFGSDLPGSLAGGNLQYPQSSFPAADENVQRIVDSHQRGGLGLPMIDPHASRIAEALGSGPSRHETAVLQKNVQAQG